jgi:hypothetical protein
MMGWALFTGVGTLKPTSQQKKVQKWQQVNSQ